MLVINTCRYFIIQTCRYSIDTLLFLHQVVLFSLFNDLYLLKETFIKFCVIEKLREKHLEQAFLWEIIPDSPGTSKLKQIRLQSSID